MHIFKMVSFNDICQSITSFIRGKTPSFDQKRPRQPIRKTGGVAKKPSSDISINSFFKAKKWLSGSSSGSGETHTHNTSTSLKRRRSMSMPPKSRKKHVIDEKYVLPVDYNGKEDFEEPTFFGDGGSDGGDTEKLASSVYGSTTEPQGTRDSSIYGLERESLMDADRISGSEVGRGSWGSQSSLDSLDDMNSAYWGSDYDSTNSLSDGDYDQSSRVPGGLMEMPKLDREFTGFGSDDEFRSEGDASESDASEDEKMISFPTRVRSKAGPGSVRPDHDAYRPSPDIVDKDLTSGIVSRYAEESDLSDEEIVRDKVAIKKEDGKEAAYDDSVEQARRWASSIKLPKGHWAYAEKELYFRLAMRGFEPIIPSNWKIDFATLPNTLFAPPGSPEPYIHPIYETEFRGTPLLFLLYSEPQLTQSL
jgi:hypothetical protein